MSAAQGWITGINTLKGAGFLQLNLTDAFTAQTDSIGNWFPTSLNTETTICSGANNVLDNTSTSQYILYGWANSYTDESNKLIGNYEIGVYQGTGAAGNKVNTRGKPAWLMIKRLDSSTGSWNIFDNKRAVSNVLFANLSNAEAVGNTISFNTDFFNLDSTGLETNASGGQYLYMVAYDTNSNGGGTYYPLASDTANLQVNNALIPIAQGIDSNGVKNTILSKNETVTGVTYTQGKNYVYYDVLGNKGVSAHRPRYLDSDLIRSYAGESPDYYNVKENKWYSTNSGSELITNGTFSSGVTTGWTANGTTLSIVNNTLKVAQGATTYAFSYQGIPTIVGKKYRVYINNIAGTYASPYCFISSTINASGTVAVYSNLLASSSTSSYTGNQEFTFVAQTTTSYIYVGLPTTGTGGDVYFDNISVFESVITPTTEITNGRNYLNHIVYADNDGGLLYVEELPKTQYVDEIKANDYKGKNACTAWVNFDGATTPPTIRDSFNVSSVVRTTTGIYDVYFTVPMNNINYTIGGFGQPVGTWQGNTISDIYTSRTISKVTIAKFENNINVNSANISLQIFGGKN